MKNTLFHHPGVDYLPLKPRESEKRIESCILSQSVPRTIETGQQLHGSDSVWAITEGVSTIIRLSDGLHIATRRAPFTFGLVDVLQGWGGYGLVAESPCKGVCIPVSRFVELATAKNLWPDIAKVMSNTIQHLLIRDRWRNDSWAAIRSQLITLNALPEEVRRRRSVLDFVLSHTGLSRSNTLKILSELRAGGYIHMENGRLRAINSMLPEGY